MPRYQVRGVRRNYQPMPRKEFYQVLEQCIDVENMDRTGSINQPSHPAYARHEAEREILFKWFSLTFNRFVQREELTVREMKRDLDHWLNCVGSISEVLELFQNAVYRKASKRYNGDDNFSRSIDYPRAFLKQVAEREQRNRKHKRTEYQEQEEASTESVTLLESFKSGIKQEQQPLTESVSSSDVVKFPKTIRFINKTDGKTFKIYKHVGMFRDHPLYRPALDIKKKLDTPSSTLDVLSRYYPSTEWDVSYWYEKQKDQELESEVVA